MNHLERSHFAIRNLDHPCTADLFLLQEGSLGFGQYISVLAGQTSLWPFMGQQEVWVGHSVVPLEGRHGVEGDAAHCAHTTGMGVSLFGGVGGEGLVCCLAVGLQKNSNLIFAVSKILMLIWKIIHSQMKSSLLKKEDYFSFLSVLFS